MGNLKGLGAERPGRPADPARPQARPPRGPPPPQHCTRRRPPPQVDGGLGGRAGGAPGCELALAGAAGAGRLTAFSPLRRQRLKPDAKLSALWLPLRPSETNLEPLGQPGGRSGRAGRAAAGRAGRAAAGRGGRRGRGAGRARARGAAAGRGARGRAARRSALLLPASSGGARPPLKLRLSARVRPPPPRPNPPRRGAGRQGVGRPERCAGGAHAGPLGAGFLLLAAVCCAPPHNKRWPPARHLPSNAALVVPRNPPPTSRPAPSEPLPRDVLPGGRRAGLGLGRGAWALPPA
jgi:hypothetical protein